jgi:hypothetical protein
MTKTFSLRRASQAGRVRGILIGIGLYCIKKERKKQGLGVTIPKPKTKPKKPKTKKRKPPKTPRNLFGGLAF